MAFLHNRDGEGHFITLRLEGTRSNRDGIGAAVRVTAGGRTRHAWRSGGGSYQSSSDPRLHFGLGSADRVDAVEVRWPSGRVDRFDDLDADRIYTIREGAPTATPQPSSRPSPGSQQPGTARQGLAS
jgi:hypothetical protein